MMMHNRAPERSQKLPLERPFHPLDTIYPKGSPLCAGRIGLINNGVDGHNVYPANPQNAVAVRKKTLDVSNRTKREARAEVLCGMKNGVSRIKAIRVNVVIPYHRNDRWCSELPADFQRVFPALLETLDASFVCQIAWHQQRVSAEVLFVDE